jgi:hypothetical protein
MIPVTELPSDHILNMELKFTGAKAVTSASGQGAILQYYDHFYELACDISGCSWTILPQELSGVTDSVMMTLPPDYTC